MAVKPEYIPWLAGLAGLLIPGMGQFLLRRRLRGLLFFMLANVIFVSALLLLGVRFYKAYQIVQASGAERWPLLIEHITAQGWGVLPWLGGLYGLLLLAAALDAFFLARRSRAI